MPVVRRQPYPADADVVIAATLGLDTDQTAALQALIDAVPNGVDGAPTVVVATPGVYRVDGGLVVGAAASYINFYCEHATFQAVDDEDPELDERRHLMFDGCDHIRVQGLTIRGAHPHAGTGDLAYVDTKEHQHAFMMTGEASHITVDNCRAYDIYGDFTYVREASNIEVTNGDYRRNGRQGFSVVEGAEVTFAGNTVADVRRSFIDVEANFGASVIDGVYVRRNNLVIGDDEWGGGTRVHRLTWFANLGAGNPTSNLYLEENFSEGGASAESGEVTSRRSNVVVRDNTFTVQSGNPGRGALNFLNWDGVIVTGNVVPLENRSPTMFVVKTTDCTAVTVTGNTFANGEGQLLVQ